MNVKWLTNIVWDVYHNSHCGCMITADLSMVT